MANGKMNSADAAMHAELGQIWRDIHADPAVSAVIFTGAGEVFSAGGDFAMIGDIIADHDTQAAQLEGSQGHRLQRHQLLQAGGERDPRPGRRRRPGRAASSPTSRSPSKTARIIDGHTRLGVAAGDHAAIVWPLLCGMAKAKYYLLLCDQLSGEEAERIGLVSLCVEDADLDAKALEVAPGSPTARRARSAGPSTASTTGCARPDPTFDASLALEFLGFTGPEVKEGLQAYLDKRKPAFPPNCPL